MLESTSMVLLSMLPVDGHYVVVVTSLALLAAGDGFTEGPCSFSVGAGAECSAAPTGRQHT